MSFLPSSHASAPCGFNERTHLESWLHILMFNWHITRNTPGIRSCQVDGLVQVQCVAMQKNYYSEKTLIPGLFEFSRIYDQSPHKWEFIVHALVSLLCLANLRSHAVFCTNDIWTCSMIA